MTATGFLLFLEPLLDRFGWLSDLTEDRVRVPRLVARHADGYVLTPLGKDLVASMQPLLAWSRTWATELETPQAGRSPSPPAHTWDGG